MIQVSPTSPLRRILPSVFLGALTGSLTAAVVAVYKFCSHRAVMASSAGYEFLSAHPAALLVLLPLLAGLSVLLAVIYRRVPNLKGGGIPTSIAALRGILSFGWLRNLTGVFGLSLISFTLGLPLGSEGPSVQMGTAVGQGVLDLFPRRFAAWKRYAMTSGACAGFAAATGAPISGILFAVEEAHQRISPLIMTSAVSAVFACELVSRLLAPILGVDTRLFVIEPAGPLPLGSIWIPLVIGLAMGLFAVLFLQYYRAVNALMNRKLGKLPHAVRIFAVLVLCVLAGLGSRGFLGSGHEVILSLFTDRPAAGMLLLLLAVRTTLTLAANTAKLTGGVFLPILSVGALFATLVGGGIGALAGQDAATGSLVLVCGLTACIASLMKMPLTAIAFAVETLGGHANILFVITAVLTAYLVTELFGARSINDTMIEKKMAEHRRGRPRIIDTHVTVGEDAFAVGKPIRDIFWPAGLFVLSTVHAPGKSGADGCLQAGDRLHIRYPVYEGSDSRDELLAIVGQQEYEETEAEEL